MASTFQDRLVTESRMAALSTINEAKGVLSRLRTQFNSLNYKHLRNEGRGNTHKYRWHSLKLASYSERASYAGPDSQALRGLDGGPLVVHDGRIFPITGRPRRCPAP